MKLNLRQIRSALGDHKYGEGCHLMLSPGDNHYAVGGSSADEPIQEQNEALPYQIGDVYLGGKQVMPSS